MQRTFKMEKYKTILDMTDRVAWYVCEPKNLDIKCYTFTFRLWPELSTLTTNLVIYFAGPSDWLTLYYKK